MMRRAISARPYPKALAALVLSDTKRRKVLDHFQNLQQLYSKIRCGTETDGGRKGASAGAGDSGGGGGVNGDKWTWKSPG